ncbi:hypothetical protein LINGRAHAP2_LOCUS10572 [Linum grandiflorum]
MEDLYSFGHTQSFDDYS